MMTTYRYIFLHLIKIQFYIPTTFFVQFEFYSYEKASKT